MAVSIPTSIGGMGIGIPPDIRKWDKTLLSSLMLINDYRNLVPELEKFKLCQLIRMFISRKTSSRGTKLDFDSSFFDRFFNDFGPHISFKAFEEFAEF